PWKKYTINSCFFDLGCRYRFLPFFRSETLRSPKLLPSTNIKPDTIQDTPLSKEEDLLAFDLVDQLLPICGMWLLYLAQLRDCAILLRMSRYMHVCVILTFPL
ncbi:hypothetical protein LINPERHAP1_LOCUS36516, partial [Linum perenne]